MKKFFSFLLFLMFFPATNAFAEYWRTYQFPNNPGYIVSVPDSYHVIYYGMSEESNALKALGITPKQAELTLEFNNAFSLIYTENFSSFIAVAEIDDGMEIDYDNLSDDEAERIAVIMEDALTQGMQSDGSLVVHDSMHIVNETDHAKYIVIMTALSMGVSNQTMIQCATSKNGRDILFTFDCLEESCLEEDVNTFEAIVNSFIIL